LKIRNNTGSPQALLAGCTVEPLDSAIAPSVVPPNYFLVIPAGVQITVPTGHWIKSTSEWATAIAYQGFTPVPGAFWSDGSPLIMSLPTITIVSA